MGGRLGVTVQQKRLYALLVLGGVAGRGYAGVLSAWCGVGIFDRVARSGETIVL
jgi:hypothetical protein